MTAIANHPHRVSSAVADARSELSSVADASVWSMDPAETTATLRELDALAAQVAELQARLLAHADRLQIAGRQRGVLDRELARRRHPDHPVGRAPDDADRPGPRPA